MSKEKHDWLVSEGLLNEDGSRPDEAPPEDAAVAEPEAVVVSNPEENGQ